MTLLPNHQKLVDDFFATIAPFEAGYADIGLSYLAIKFGDRFIITQGKLFLSSAIGDKRSRHFQSASVRAGHYPLSELEVDVRTLVDHLLAGHVDTPHGPLHFPAAHGGHHAVSLMPFHPEALQAQLRQTQLTIMGGQREPIVQPDIDWEVKVAPLPYDGLQELANDFGLGPLAGETTNVAIVAFNVAVIDGRRSKVDGTNADVHVLLAEGLSTDRVAVSYRSYVTGNVAERLTVSGDKMEWTHEPPLRRGRLAIQVANATVINCTVSYGGIAQAHLWIADPARAQNPRRAVYEAFDPQLQNLQIFISGALARGQEARNLEAAVAWLLWMLGFNVAHLGAMPRSQDAADLLATAPTGHFLVVECTTGLLKAENKLALLHARANAVRRRLDESNNSVLRVLPVIVTSRTRAEVTPDIDAAERLGIYVLTRENLEQSIVMTMRQQDADKLYDGALQIMSTALAKHQAQGNLPLTAAP